MTVPPPSATPSPSGPTTPPPSPAPTPSTPLSPSPLSPTPRTTLGRSRERAVPDRAALHAVLAEGTVAHVGVVVDGVPRVLPSAYGWDAAGPDAEGTLYLHGSVAAVWLRAAAASTVCVTVTLTDGMVLARSGFHHSMNYRTAVVVGDPRAVDDPEERLTALDLVVDQLVPGRAATLRRPTRKELAATLVLAVPLVEASVKARSGDPVDEPEDVAAGGWAGVLPMRVAVDDPVTARDSTAPVPADVRRRGAASHRTEVLHGADRG